MKKKILSLALALALCLGLTIPALAAKTNTETYDYNGVTITAQYDGGSTGYVSYTGSGKLTIEHVEVGLNVLSGLTMWPDKVSISIGQGLTMTEEFKEQWTKAAENYGFSVTFNDSTAPSQPQQPAAPAASKSAAPTNDKLEVNGAAANPTVYKIGDSNYFKIRDVAALLNGTEKQFSVGYDSSVNSVTATTGEGYEKQSGDLTGAAAGGSQTADPSNDTIYVNGQKVEAEVYKINGSNYFKLRDLGKALNFYVGWTAERGMYIETASPYSE